MDEQNEPKIRAGAWLSQIVRLLLFPVVIMWPAGTWRWWEAWALVGLWFAIGAVMTVYLRRHDPALLAERMKGSPVQEGQEAWDKVWMLFVFVAGLGLFVTPGFDVARFGWSEPLPQWVEILALAVHLPCFLLIGWVTRENTYASKVVKIDEEREHGVITTGPYALVRHPMYTAVIVIVLAMPTALGSRFGLIPGACLALLIVLRTFMEDRTLHAELEGYPQYAAKTRYRLIPGVL